MERNEALSKLTKLLGKGLRYEVNNKALAADDREIAKGNWKLAVEEYDRVSKACDERKRALLQADAEYQSLRTKWKELEKVRQQLSGAIHARKFTVGKVNGLFFHVLASGDSWEEIINTVRREQDDKIAKLRRSV
jgi:hypothetical protein